MFIKVGDGVSLIDIFRSAIQKTILDIEQNVVYESSEDCSITNYSFTSGNWIYQKPVGTDLLFDRDTIKKALKAKKNPFCIILLLESPHKSEFKKKPYYPAQGTGNGDTGTLIMNNLHKLFNHLKIIGPSDIYFVNRIQFQTSLGISNEDLKTQIFFSMWSNVEVKNSLRERLKEIVDAYIQSSIIDCNTSQIRSKIKKNDIFVPNKGGNIHLYKADHPSSWIGKDPSFVKTPEAVKKVSL